MIELVFQKDHRATVGITKNCFEGTHKETENCVGLFENRLTNAT